MWLVNIKIIAYRTFHIPAGSPAGALCIRLVRLVVCPSRCPSRANIGSLVAMMAVGQHAVCAGESIQVPTLTRPLASPLYMLLRGHKMTVGGLQLSGITQKLSCCSQMVSAILQMEILEFE